MLYLSLALSFAYFLCDVFLLLFLVFLSLLRNEQEDEEAKENEKQQQQQEKSIINHFGAHKKRTHRGREKLFSFFLKETKKKCQFYVISVYVHGD